MYRSDEDLTNVRSFLKENNNNTRELIPGNEYF